MGRNLTLADETVIDGGEAGYSQGFLWCYINGFTLQQAALIFFDADKTSRIDFHYGEMVDTYEGYTNCISLKVDADGMVSVCLTKGANNV